MSKLSSPLNAAAKIAIVERILASWNFASDTQSKFHIAVVKLLLAANAKGKDGIAACSALARGCRSVDVNAKDEYGNTALMKAARRGNTAIVELLLAVPGIDVNAQGNYGGTALMEAAGGGDTEIVRLLLASPGIDVNAKDEYGNTALITAAGNGDTAVVELLLAAPGIDVNVAAGADCEHTPYCMCFFCCFCDGDDHPSLFWYGETALICAAGSGDTAVVELLLAAPGIDVNAKDDVGQTALIAAARMGKIAVVRAIERFIAGQAMNMWIPRHRARQRDRVGLSELDREGTPFIDAAYYTTQGFL